MFKLYRRREERLEYHQAWAAENEIIEHWGVCGEFGRMLSHPLAPEVDRFALLKRLGAEAKAKGFRAIPPSRHAGLIVETVVPGFGDSDYLHRRHDLESFLDQRLGWLGLGHCDGGSIGSGSMEAFCRVVDAKVAIAALGRELAKSQFSEFRVRRWRNGERR